MLAISLRIQTAFQSSCWYWPSCVFLKTPLSFSGFSNSSIGASGSSKTPEGSTGGSCSPGAPSGARGLETPEGSTGDCGQCDSAIYLCDSSTPEKNEWKQSGDLEI